MKLNDKITTVVILFVMFVVSLLGLYLLVVFLSKDDSGSLGGASKTKESNLEVNKTIGSDGQPVTTIVMPSDRIPESAEDRESAPPLALLPSHMPSSSLEEDTEVPISSRDDIRQITLDFLKNYETFDPDRSWYAEAHKTPDPYTRYLDPYVYPGQLDVIVRREESDDLDGVCPQTEADCVNSSFWTGGNNPVIRDYDSDNAYVTVSGAVRYGSTYPGDPLKGKTSFREYGILLKKDDSKWKVFRVVAETGEEISI